jgi:hypothetical protein
VGVRQVAEVGYNFRNSVGHMFHIPYFLTPAYGNAVKPVL